MPKYFGYMLQFAHSQTDLVYRSSENNYDIIIFLNIFSLTISLPRINTIFWQTFPFTDRPLKKCNGLFSYMYGALTGTFQTCYF